VTLSSALVGALLLLVAAACGREPEPTLGRLPASRGPTPETLLRIPREGGTPKLYRVPALQPSSWKAEDTLPPLERTVGADAEQGVVFLLDQKRNVVALDLETRRVRPSLEQVRRATLGPDGALYVIDTGSTVTQLIRRAPVRFRSKLQGTPGELHATMAGALLAKVPGKRPALEVLGSDQSPVSIPVPPGDLATSLWGDLVAVAADSAVVTYETQGKRASHSIRVSDHARSVLFSPSGHRLYVARESDKLLVLDRFGGEILGQIDLPNSARGLRGDRYGQWLLVRPEVGDSVWVVDVGRGRYVGSAPSQWDDDLPAVASPSTLLLRQGKDVVARELSAKGLPVTGKVEGGSADFWLPLAWRPAQDAEVPIAADSSALAAAGDSGGAPSVYLQVSSSQNPTWANELSQKLRGAGLPATVLAPKRSDEAYRVVLGPYATREQAEATGRKIGMPSFIVTAQDAPTP
jgi:SPOR domain